MTATNSKFKLCYKPNNMDILIIPIDIINKLFSNAGRVVGHPPPVFGKILLRFKKKQSGAIG